MTVHRVEPPWAHDAVWQGKDDPTTAALKASDPEYAAWLISPFTRRLRDAYYTEKRAREDLETQKHVWTYAFAHSLMLQQGLFKSADGAIKIVEGMLEALPTWAPPGSEGGELAHVAAHRIVVQLEAVKGTMSRAFKMIFTPEGGAEEDEDEGGSAPPAVAP